MAFIWTPYPGHARVWELTLPQVYFEYWKAFMGGGIEGGGKRLFLWNLKYSNVLSILHSYTVCVKTP